MSIAAHRFDNDLRYGDGDHPRQWHLTPKYVLDPVREDLGGRIGLDPCTFADNPTRATEFYAPPADGLSHEWWSRTYAGDWKPSVFCNPPYGKAREQWVELCMAAGDRGQRVILLMPSHTDTRTFQRAVSTSTRVVFIRGRVKFGSKRDNGRQHAASHPSVLIGWNTKLNACSSLGLRVHV